MNCTTARTTLPPPTIDRRLRSRISTPRQSSSCNSTNELRFYANSLLLQHSIRLSHARSDCSGSMHLLLNQWTVTIRFHICHRLEGFSAKKFSFCCIAKHKKANERRKENLIDFSFSVCLVENLVSLDSTGAPHKWPRIGADWAKNPPTYGKVESLSVRRRTRILSFLDVMRYHYVWH